MSEQAIKNEDKVWESAEFWGRELNADELEKIEVVARLVPEDVGTVLDVGCGDGRIANRLSEMRRCGRRLRVTGTDMSEEALKRVKTEKFRSRLPKIPRNDREFDLVLATDVVEHIPERDYKAAICELGRLAGRYVLLAVPYREDRRGNVAKCGECGRIFDASQHHRTIDDRAITEIAGWLFDFELIRREKFGQWRYRYPGAFWFLRNRVFGKYVEVRGNVCPYCGQEQETRRADESGKGGSLAGRAWQKMKTWNPWKDRAEIGLVFERKDLERRAG